MEKWINMSLDSKIIFFKIMLSVFLLLVVAGSGMAASAEYYTPSYALKEAGTALSVKDEKAFHRFVDCDSLIKNAYDDGSRELSDNIVLLSERYPADWFFKHDTAFMKSYTKAHRKDAIDMAGKVMELYFKGTQKPAVFEDNPAAWVASDLDTYLNETSAEIVAVSLMDGGDRASATIRLHGHGAYGSLLDGVEFSLELKISSTGIWQINRITNPHGLLLPVTDSAEKYWKVSGWED